ncbi:MAG: hypothetical protein JWM41_2969 [Gemmatimonadetes bacterium]|nr:hypothetical protein [Gemmatimonadota bacterium]
MMKRVRRSGFTLPEVLVTVTVVAVLAAVVVPAVTQYVGKGDAPATQTDLNEIRNSITAYVSDTRKYPTTFYDLSAGGSGTVTGWKGPYNTVQLAGATAAGTFTSAGLNIKLGAAFTNSGGYLTTPLVFNSSTATCQDLWNLDKSIDGGTGLIADAATMSTSGLVTWVTACNVANGTGNNAATALLTAGNPVITLRVLAVGT